MSETATEDKNLQQVQDRLMKMLDSVRLDPDAPSEAPPRQKKETSTPKKASLQVPDSEQESDETCCPSCDSTEPWNGSSWCPKCGYYPKLNQKIVRRDPSEFADAEYEEDEELSVIGLILKIPKWIFWISGGILLLLIESVAIRFLVLDIVTRSQIAILQVLIGANLFGIAHIRAYMIASQDNESINFISIFFAPTKIWGTTLERMPSVSKTVCSGSWGLAAALFAVLFIGVDYDNLFSPENFQRESSVNPLKMIVGTMTQSAKNGGTTVASDGKSSGSLEDALKDFAGDSDPGGQQQSSGASTSSDQEFTENYSESKDGHVIIHSTVPLVGKKAHKKEYIVFGFLTNSAGELRSILLAEELDGKKGVRFSGKYIISVDDDPFLAKFRSSLDHHLSRRPAMKTIYNANWTAPALVCKIAHNGVTPDGRFQEGQITSYYDQAPATENNDLAETSPSGSVK